MTPCDPDHLFLDCCNNSYLFPPLSVPVNPCYFQHDTLTDLFKMWTKSCDSSTWDPHTWNKIQVLPYGPEIPCLNVYPKELKSRCGRDYALCCHCNIIPRSRDMRWRNMSLSRRTDKSYVVLTYGVYYSLLKGKESLPCMTIWMKLEGAIYSGKSQSQKDESSIISLMSSKLNT